MQATYKQLGIFILAEDDESKMLFAPVGIEPIVPRCDRYDIEDICLCMDYVLTSGFKSLEEMDGWLSYKKNWRLNKELYPVFNDLWVNYMCDWVEQIVEGLSEMPFEDKLKYVHLYLSQLGLASYPDYL